MSDLKNPMRFSIKKRTVNIEHLLRHEDFSNKNVTKIDVRPGDGQLYVYWEEQ